MTLAFKMITSLGGRSSSNRFCVGRERIQTRVHAGFHKETEESAECKETFTPCGDECTPAQRYLHLAREFPPSIPTEEHSLALRWRNPTTKSRQER